MTNTTIQNLKKRVLISIIICTYNRCKNLKDALASLLEQKHDNNFDYEIIVVNNNSKDKTKEITESYMSKFNNRLRCIFEENQGISYARNTGIRYAMGEIIAFMDDDCIATSDWILNIYNAFILYNPMVVGGRVKLHFNNPTPKWFSKKFEGAVGLWDKGDKVIIADNNYEGMVGIGANISFKKEVFSKFDLFRTDLGRKGKKLLMGEETELYQKIKKAGEKCIYFPLATVYHCIDHNKIQKKYIRCWFFRFGEWNCISELNAEEKAKNIIFGIPRWEYRDFLSNVLRFLLCTIKGLVSDAFYHELRIYSFCGYCWQKLKLTYK